MSLKISSAIPTAKEPPTEPADPPRNPKHFQGVRAQALTLAAALYSVPASESLVLPTNVFVLADEIVAYITDGTKP